MIIKRLEMKNFLSHIHSVIDFDKFDTALILGSYADNFEESNGSGKSSVLDSIRWALFDRSRHKKKNGVVKRDTSECMVSLEFMITSTLYRITRKRNKVLNESDVILEQWTDKQFKNIGCDTNSATDAKISKLISFNHDTFINSVYFKQNDISMFAESTPGTRKDVLKDLLKIQKWDDYQKKARKEEVRLKSLVDKKEALLIPISNIQADILDTNDRLDTLDKLLKEYNIQYNTLHEKYISSQMQYENAVGNEEDKERLSNLYREKESDNKRTKILLKNINNNQEIIDKNNAIIETTRTKLQKLRPLIEKKNSIDIENNIAMLITGKTKLRLLKEEIRDLRSQSDLTKNCDKCFREISSKKDAEIIKIKRQEYIDKKLDSLKIANKKIKSAESKMLDLESAYALGLKAEVERGKLEAKRKLVKAEITHLDEKNQIIGQELNKINSKDIDSLISDLSEKFNMDKIADLKKLATDLYDKTENIKNQINGLNVECGVLQATKKDLLGKLSTQMALDKELSDLNKELDRYLKIKQYFGKDGIQAIIIESVIGELEQHANIILDKICNEPTRISIKTEKQSDKGSWSETFEIEVHVGNFTDGLEAFSGGELFRISLALRLALSKILAKRIGGSLNFLLLDEVSSSLDVKGLNMFVDIVKQLGNNMKVLIITHDDRLKDKFEDIILVSKTKQGTVIV